MDGENKIVGGACSEGKTTTFEEIQSMPPSERIITIEDGKELFVKPQN